MKITQNAQIMEDLKTQFTIVSFDLEGDGHITTIVCYAHEHSEKEINELERKYDEGYSNDEIDMSFVEYLTEQNINFYQM